MISQSIVELNDANDIPWWIIIVILNAF